MFSIPLLSFLKGDAAYNEWEEDAAIPCLVEHLSGTSFLGFLARVGVGTETTTENSDTTL